MGNEPITDIPGLLEICNGLISGWAASAGTDAEFGQRDRIPDVPRFISVFGLAAHTHRLAEQAVPMLAKRLTLEAMPMIRLMYECALNAMWLAQNEDGSNAFMNKETKSRKAIVRTLAESSWRDRQFPEFDAGLLESASDPQAGNFEALCKDLQPGGADAYAIYRLLCRYGHATGFIVDKYARFDADLKLVGIAHFAEFDSDSLWTYFTALCLLWAGTAADLIDPSRTRRSELQAAERTLGTTRVLQLSPLARQRLSKASEARRRSEYRPPKRRKKDRT